MKTFTLKKSTELHVITPHRFLIDYKNELNVSQYEAVTSVNGPHLIIAGAGTGKTRTIVYRVAYLVELGVNPKHILLLTFTRKAAQEMLRRASILLDDRCENVSGGTFHAYANSVLRKYGSLLGYDSNFTILDQRDAEDVINLIRTRLKLDTKQRRFPKKETLYDLYSRSVNMMQPLGDLLVNDYPHYKELEEEIGNVCKAYVLYKKSHNLMDYDDLLINLLQLLNTQESVKQILADQCKYIMVDEFQDTNKLQSEIVKSLASKYNNLMVVGDDSQAIYAFRGATIRNILDFPEQITDCKIIKLEENYRSTQPILNVANAILQAGIE
ncbi:MAG: ATP-dependent helicase [Ignavibacteriae bacterium]|nr:ATP-dependent helicase [Ignavibacteriota bacterium]